jgi:cyclopropane-fatty-acyl-phospholipid synthase
MLSHLSGARQEWLRLRLPDGSHQDFGSGDESLPVHLEVNDYRFFSRVVLGSDIGLGESYMYAEWDTEDIAAVIAFFIRNRNRLKDGEFKESLLARLLEKFRFLSRANTLIGSRRNIRKHYDLSNAFFRTFLDETMAYSCAIFRKEDESLNSAQKNKYRVIIEKARLNSSDHLLEIGCGWGGFAIEAVRKTGCRVTGITISKAQYQLARQRVQEAGLQNNIRILLRDYRKMSGCFDKIVSIEMLEAVGHENFGIFFQQLDRLLAPDGVVVIQSITIPDQRYDVYRKTHDWIQKHIFPGGLLPSLTRLVQTMTRHSTLMVDHAENIGNHYATTLSRWHRRFVAHEEQVNQLGFDETFKRKWSYYLKCCEAGFRQRALGNLQLVLTREGNVRLAD